MVSFDSTFRSKEMMLQVINRVVVVGRVAGDSVLRYSRDGLPISAFSISVGRSDRQPEFLPVVAFRRLAEATSQYLRKGRLVGVEGRLACRTYEAGDGEKRRVIEIIADRLRFLDPPIPVADDEADEGPDGSDHS